MNREPGVDARRLPLTTAQMAMWFSQVLDPSNPLYQAAEVVEIHGPVDLALLDEALRQAVTETESLRARFESDDDGRVWQIVEPLPDWPLPVMDLRDRPDPTASAYEWMRTDLNRQLDLNRSPLFSFAALRTAEERFLLYICLHHIALDGYGFSLFIKRVTEVYTASEASLPRPQCQWGSLTQALADEADYHGSEASVRDRDYWAAQLASRPTASRSASPWTVVPHTFIRKTGYVAPSAADGLRALARKARTGLPTIAMAALALYVHRLSGNGEVTLDLTVTGRVGATARSVPTMMASVLPLRTRMEASTTIADLLRHTADQARGLLRHQRYSTSLLVRELGISQHVDGYLADWGINIMTHDSQLRFGEHPAVLRNLSNGPVTGLGINVYDRSADGSLQIDFNADPFRYDAEVTAAHHNRFLTLLNTLAAIQPEQTIGAIDLLSADERHQVLTAWNDTERLVPATTLPELFGEQARRSPETTALVCGDVTLSGAELNARANRLAHLLIARGAGPETYVALALPRTTDHIIALLAVLKAGAACLPVDVNHPVERIRTILADVRPLCVLTMADAAPALQPDQPMLLVDDADTARDLGSRSDIDPVDSDRSTPLLPHHPAYVSFTSGSTGRPKGVVVEHRQLTNLFFDHHHELIAPAAATVGRRLRAALTASFSFDTAWEGALFLAAGHELHLIEDEVRLRPSVLVQYLAERQIDFVDLTPSYLRQLLAAGLLTGEGGFPWLLMVGGEAIDTALWARLRDCHGITAYNYYGPTECTVDAVYCRLDEQGDHPVLGRPGYNVRAYVLDGALQPMPPMVPGELYLAGDQVARGYLGQPELTAERFVDDPFGPAGARMYRTGDLACWTERGVLEYLGRNDDQVKIRGVRIEPGEIEAVLAQHPEVAHAAVTVHESESDDRSLAAYVVPESGALNVTGLRSWATARLPSYLVPSTFALLEALPLTTHGKLDYTALPAANAPAEHQERSACSAREQQLCALYAQVLGVPEVSIDDDFFDLGGHSLLAAELAARIRTDLGATLSLGAVYQEPTVAGLARLLVDDAQPAAFGMLLPLRTTGTATPLFCVHPAGGLSWCYATLPRHVPEDVAVYGLQARGLNGAEELPASFPEMVDDYVRHIRCVQKSGPYQLLGWSLGGALAHAIAVRLQAQGERVVMLAMLDSRPIDPLGPLGALPDEHDALPLLLEAAGVESATDSALGDEHLAAVTAVLAHSLELLPTFAEGVFDGDLVYFRATEGKPEHVPTSEAWRPWVTGEVASHDIACTHHAMTQAEPLTLIGQILSCRLDTASGRR
jgi:enterobactin synthetase component F